MQIDIGFGDVVVPGPTKIEYPTLLNFPAPVLQAYPRETVIAEKLEAITKLGLLNSGMKDYYDIALLSRMYPFEGEDLIGAIMATFRYRETKIEAEPIGLTDAFYADTTKGDPMAGIHSPQPVFRTVRGPGTARGRNTPVRTPSSRSRRRKGF